LLVVGLICQAAVACATPTGTIGLVATELISISPLLSILTEAAPAVAFACWSMPVAIEPNASTVATSTLIEPVALLTMLASIAVAPDACCETPT